MDEGQSYDPDEFYPSFGGLPNQYRREEDLNSLVDLRRISEIPNVPPRATRKNALFPPSTPMIDATRRIVFDSVDGNSVKEPPATASKMKTRVVASRFMQPSAPTPRDKSLNTSLIAPKSKQALPEKPANISLIIEKPRQNFAEKSLNFSMIAPRSKPAQMPSKVASKPLPQKVTADPLNLPPSTTRAQPKPAGVPTSGSNENPKSALLLLNNLLLQYCYSNALAENLFIKQQERAEKTLYNTFLKLQQLRTELFEQKQKLFYIKYTQNLDKHLALQEQSLNSEYLQLSQQYYKQLAESLYSTTHRLPLVGVHANPTDLFDTLKETNQILEDIKQRVGPYRGHVSTGATSLLDLQNTLTEETHEIDKCKSLLMILNTIENQLSSLWIQDFEDEKYEEFTKPINQHALLSIPT